MTNENEKIPGQSTIDALLRLKGMAPVELVVLYHIPEDAYLCSEGPVMSPEDQRLVTELFTIFDKYMSTFPSENRPVFYLCDANATDLDPEIKKRLDND